MLAGLRKTVRELRQRNRAVGFAVDSIQFAQDLVVFPVGAACHTLTGRTPHIAHMALVRWFSRTGGWANDLLSALLSLLHGPYRIPEASRLLPAIGRGELDAVQASMERDGYCILPQKLPAEFCDRIARAMEGKDFAIRDDSVPWQPERLIKYDRNAPVAHNYMLPNDDITDIPEVQDLISDPVLINVAQNYLKAVSIFSGMSLYYSAAVKDEPDMESAQAFHWDLERIRWIRFFIYLNDVDENNGPHCFIRGTHRTGGIPRQLLSRGYVRYTDEEVIAMCGKENYREFHATKGTILAEDSRGLHKGKVLKRGERVMLAFELSNSTFGASKRHRIRNIHVPRFGEYAQKYPRLYKNFDF